MPKSSKIRKEKAADFSKAKLKLGKGKQTPSNAIDTSFKARSIALPIQSVIGKKDASGPTTKRGLNFDDLIAHLKHYNAGTRRDAILGLRELLEAHEELLDSSLAALINACVQIIGDEDASVRKVLLAFFAWALPQVPHENLVPHSHLLLLFTASAQTHIFLEIRIDAVRFLNLFLDYIPDAVVAGWKGSNASHGSRILEGYLGILNAGIKFGETDGPVKTTSTASVVLSPSSKLVVLQSLSIFLSKALASTHNSTDSFANPMAMTINTWYLIPSFSTPEAYHVFHCLLQPFLQSSRRLPPARHWQPGVDDTDDDFVQDYPFAQPPADGCWSLQRLSDVVGPAGGLSDTETFRMVDHTFVARLARTLHSTLISTFLDCAPEVLSPGEETGVKLMIAVGEIARTLYRALLQAPLSEEEHSSTFNDLKALLQYMANYFPFRLGGRNIKLEQAFEDLNVIFCELTSLLVLTSRTNPSVCRTRGGRPRQAHRGAPQTTNTEGNFLIQTVRVSDFVIQLLRSETTTASQVERSLTPAGYIALLPTIWSILNTPSSNHRELSNRVLRATIDHSLKVTSKSALKRTTIEFVANVILLETEPQYQGHFRLGRSADEDEKVEEWICHLPKTLWELGANNLLTTETVVRFMLRILQRRSRLLHSQLLASLRSRLVPYFSITHATRGQVLGPYCKLPSSSVLRRLVLDVVATFLSFEGDGVHDDGLSNAVDTAVADTEEQSYWVQLKTLY